MLLIASIAATDNATLRRLLLGIGKQSLRYRYLAYSRFPDLMNRSVEGNRDLLDFGCALQAPAAARAAVGELQAVVVQQVDGQLRCSIGGDVGGAGADNALVPA